MISLVVSTEYGGAVTATQCDFVGLSVHSPGSPAGRDVQASIGNVHLYGVGVGGGGVGERRYEARSTKHEVRS